MYQSDSIKLLTGIDPPIYVWIYRLFMRAITRTSIIVLAFKRRAKKSNSWSKMMEKDPRCRRVTDTGAFVKSLEKTS